MRRPTYIKLPPGPDNDAFQQYAFDEYLGSTGTQKGLDLTNQTAPSNMDITKLVTRDLEDTYKALTDGE
jgi:hypothetical protein